MPELTTLDERLAEIDERLRSLQDGLDVEDPIVPEEPTRSERAPRPERAPLRAVDGTPGVDPNRLVTQLRELADAHERLLELHRDLLSQYAGLLERRAAETLAVSVVAGPFADHSALRDFERELGALPDVTGVTAREFLSGDRVTLDVRVAPR